MGNMSFGWLGEDPHHLSFSMLVILSFAISLNIKPISAGDAMPNIIELITFDRHAFKALKV